jgi:hypothetical protein
MTTLQIINQFVAFSLRQIIQQDSQAAIVQYANVIICTNIDALYNPTIYIIVKLFTTTYSSMMFLMFCRGKLKSCHFYSDRNPWFDTFYLKKTKSIYFGFGYIDDDECTYKMAKFK